MVMCDSMVAFCSLDSEGLWGRRFGDLVGFQDDEEAVHLELFCIDETVPHTADLWRYQIDHETARCKVAVLHIEQSLVVGLAKQANPHVLAFL
jgi:hypothetical protein